MRRVASTVLGTLDIATGALNMNLNWLSGDFRVNALIVANAASSPPESVISAIPDTAECDGPSGATLDFFGESSFDLDNDLEQYLWAHGGPDGTFHSLGVEPNVLSAKLPLGENIVQLLTLDHRLGYGFDFREVVVKDTTSPVIISPPNISVECSAATGQPVEIGTARAIDACDSTVTVKSDAPSVYHLGTTTVTWTSIDTSGNKSTANQTVNVVDSVPPKLMVSATPTKIWPPNKDLITIDVTATASDACTETVPIILVEAVAEEPGSEKPIPVNAIIGAAVGTADFSFQVVADRSGSAKQGRLYKFTYEATDVGGNRSRKTVIITVPHNQ